MNEVFEENATPRQVRKLYAVLHNNGISTKEFKDKLQIVTFGQLGKKQISKIIEGLETNHNYAPQQPEQQQQPQKKVDEVADVTDKGNEKEHVDHIEEKGKILKKCVNVATKIVAETRIFVPPIDEYQRGSVILQITKLLFENRDE